MSSAQPIDDGMPMTTIRVVLPGHLCTLAGMSGEVPFGVTAPVTIGSVLDAIEERFPVLRGAIRDHHGGPRRPYVRFFACGQDLSLGGFDARVPREVIDGPEPFLIVGSIAGGQELGRAAQPSADPRCEDCVG